MELGGRKTITAGILALVGIVGTEVLNSFGVIDVGELQPTGSGQIGDPKNIFFMVLALLVPIILLSVASYPLSFIVAKLMLGRLKDFGHAAVANYANIALPICMAAGLGLGLVFEYILVSALIGSW